MIWVAGRSPTLVSQNLKATTLTYLAITTRLIRENQTIVAETLAVKNMIRNSRLAKAISDVGWGELLRQLEYKAQWYGRTLIQVDRWFPSSKTCSNCGHTLAHLPLRVREWECRQCHAIAKHTKVDMIWVAGRSHALVLQNF